ncbi:hypothetical protein BT69DRAFT_1317318 [Atractiella rhizophila]|nr:hypothetical protein BT69DRAFT_1317318 [Atractiella rhizophila]
MKSFSAILSFSMLASTFALPILRRQSACFITGNAVLPTDVVVDTSVTCTGSTGPVGVPDVEKGGVKFVRILLPLPASDVSFTKDTSISAVAFALKNFATPANAADADLTFFQNVDAVYGATNAALRSIGSSPSAQPLAALKGPAFFLGFQIARINNDNGVQGIEHKLGKVLKNCLGCDTATKQAVIDLAASSGIDVSGFSAA